MSPFPKKGKLRSFEVTRRHQLRRRCIVCRVGMAQTITSDGDEERLGEGVERIWGPLPLEPTAKFGAHAPVCSFVVHPVAVLDVPTCWQWSRQMSSVMRYLPTTRRTRCSSKDFHRAPPSTIRDASTRREPATATSSTRATFG